MANGAADSVAGSTIVAIIPARLGSTRFPGKVLASKTGKPLIQHVCEGAAKSKLLSRVVVATERTASTAPFVSPAAGPM